MLNAFILYLNVINIIEDALPRTDTIQDVHVYVHLSKTHVADIHVYTHIEHICGMDFILRYYLYIKR